MLEALSRQKIDVLHAASKKIITYHKENYLEKLKETLQLRAQGKAVELIPERLSEHE